LVEFMTGLGETWGCCVIDVSTIEQHMQSSSLVDQVVAAVAALGDEPDSASRTLGMVSAEAVEGQVRRAEVFAPLRAAVFRLRGVSKPPVVARPRRFPPLALGRRVRDHPATAMPYSGRSMDCLQLLDRWSAPSLSPSRGLRRRQTWLRQSGRR
jgi:hypothetical protein